MRSVEEKRTFVHHISEAIVILSLLLFTLSVYIASNNIAKGMYEVSIYEAYPSIFWVTILTALFLGLLRVVIDIFIIKTGYRWVWGLFIILIVNSFVLFLPIFRDYAFAGQWDVPRHYSFTLDIIERGIPSNRDHYPFSHALAATLAQISNLSLEKVITIFPLLFYFFGVANVGFLATIVDESPAVRGLIITSASIPVFKFYQIMFYPLQMAVFMLWLFVGWFLKTRLEKSTWKDSLLLVLIIFSLPFIHSLGVIASIILLGSFFLSRLVEYFRGGINKLENKSFKPFEIIFAPVAIVFISWFTWFSTFRFFGIATNRIVQAFINGVSGTVTFEKMTSAVDRAGLDIFGVLKLVIFHYWPGIVYIGLAGIAILILIFQGERYNEKTIKAINFLPLFMIVFSVGAVLSLFLDLITSNPFRYLNYATAFSPIIVGVAFGGRKIASLLFNGFAAVFFFVSIFSAQVISLFNIYFSPLTGDTNNQFSYAQRAGYNFLLDFESEGEGNIYSPIQGAGNLAGVISFNTRTDKIKENARWLFVNAPAHFGYEGMPDNLGYEFVDPEYLFITGFEYGYYTEVWPEHGRFTSADFDQLFDDPNWSKIYESGDFYIWIFRPGR